MPRPVLLLMLAALVVYLACFNSLQVGQHVDDARYVMAAQSLGGCPARSGKLR